MIIFPIILALLYFSPTIVAVRKKKKNSSSIFVVNFFFGWTFIGWVVALSWALSKDEVKTDLAGVIANNITHDLERLAMLKEKGALTQEEFEIQKKKILEV